MAASNLIRGALGFAISLVVTRALTPHERGIFGFVAITSALLVMLAGVGMPAALTWAKAKRGVELPDLYRASLLIGAVGGAAVSLLFMCAFWIWRLGLFAEVTTWEAVVVAVLVPPLLVLTHWNVLAYLEDRILQFTLAALTGVVVSLVGMSITAATVGLDVRRAIGIWAVSSFLPFAIILRRSRVRAFWRTGPQARLLTRFAFRANLASVALILAWRLDVWFVKGYRGATELGYYVVAVSLAEIAFQIAISFRVALTPLQGSADGRHQLVPSICGVTRVAIAFGSVCAVVMALVASPLIRLLYGDDYVPAATALVWLVAGIVALIAQGPLIDFLLVEGRVRGVTIAATSALALNVGLDVVLLQHHSFVAAAAASTAAYVASCAACVWLFRRTTGTRLSDIVLLKMSDIRRMRSLAQRLLAPTWLGRSGAVSKQGAD